LTVHSVKTKQKLAVQEALPEPRSVEKLVISYKPKEFGMAFKKDAATVKETLEGLEEDKLQCIMDELESKGYLLPRPPRQDVAYVTSASSVKCADGKSYEVTPSLLSISRQTIVEHGKSNCQILLMLQ
jgi:glycyl-tRNA synthetase